MQLWLPHQWVMEVAVGGIRMVGNQVLLAVLSLLVTCCF